MKYYFVLLMALLLTQSCASQKEIQLIEGSMETKVSEKLDYYLYYPESYNENQNKKFPILLFLHGGGESGENLSIIKKNGPPKMLAEGKQFPFLVLAPQNPYKQKWWNTRAVVQLLDSIVATNRIDKNRIYLSGLSRGGGAAWEMAVQFPDKFAAMAVVCGMAPLPYAHWINKEMPIWVFHGDQDTVIPVTESIKMVDRLKEMGYTVKLTIYEGVGHNSWEKAYADDQLYTWLNTQQKMD